MAGPRTPHTHTTLLAFPISLRSFDLSNSFDQFISCDQFISFDQFFSFASLLNGGGAPQVRAAHEALAAHFDTDQRLTSINCLTSLSDQRFDQ